MWAKFQLKPSIPDPDRDMYATDAYRGGGPLALTSECRQELRPKIRWLVQPARDRLLKDCLSKDYLLKNVTRQSFIRQSRASWIDIVWFSKYLRLLGVFFCLRYAGTTLIYEMILHSCLFHNFENSWKFFDVLIPEWFRGHPALDKMGAIHLLH